MGGLLDLSWHNDVCPRFALSEDGSGPNLWVDHVDPQQRENGPDTPRFLVIVQMGDSASSDDAQVHEGNDLRDAVAAFVAAAHSFKSRN